MSGRACFDFKATLLVLPFFCGVPWEEELLLGVGQEEPGESLSALCQIQKRKATGAWVWRVVPGPRGRERVGVVWLPETRGFPTSSGEGEYKMKPQPHVGSEKPELAPLQSPGSLAFASSGFLHAPTLGLSFSTIVVRGWSPDTSPAWTSCMQTLTGGASPRINPGS